MRVAGFVGPELVDRLRAGSGYVRQPRRQRWPRRRVQCLGVPSGRIEHVNERRHDVDVRGCAGRRRIDRVCRSAAGSQVRGGRRRECMKIFRDQRPQRRAVRRSVGSRLMSCGPERADVAERAILSSGLVDGVGEKGIRPTVAFHVLDPRSVGCRIRLVAHVDDRAR